MRKISKLITVAVLGYFAIWHAWPFSGRFSDKFVDWLDTLSTNEAGFSPQAYWIAQFILCCAVMIVPVGIAVLANFQPDNEEEEHDDPCESSSRR